jgi:hypothetical protein
LIAVRENLLKSCALALVQVVVLPRDRLARAIAHQLGVFTSASAHVIDRFSFQLNHRRRCERAPWPALFLLDGDKVASLDPAIGLQLDVVEARLTERSLQRVTQNRPFFDYRFALQIAITCKGYGSLCHIILLTLVLHVVHGPMLGRFNDLRRLVPETLGDLLMPLLHLPGRHVELGFSRLVGCDLRRRRALPIRLGQVFLDLLTAWAGRVEVLARVASDLWLAAATALDLVTEGGQSRCQSDR